jgi:solute carrier family 35 protein E1
VLGVAIASMKELSFTWTGFLAGMASNLFYQLRIVLSKKELNGESNVLTPANFFRVLTIISAVELLPISIALEGYKVRSVWESAIAAGLDTDVLMSNMLISGFSYYCYNEISFWILGSISPMTHAVGNTVKRVVIIIASIVILKSPMSNNGIVGSAIAVLGTLAYSLAVHRASLDKAEKIANEDIKDKEWK